CFTRRARRLVQSKGEEPELHLLANLTTEIPAWACCPRERREGTPPARRRGPIRFTGGWSGESRTLRPRLSERGNRPSGATPDGAGVRSGGWGRCAPPAAGERNPSSCAYGPMQTCGDPPATTPPATASPWRAAG